MKNKAYGLTASIRVLTMLALLACTGLWFRDAHAGGAQVTKPTVVLVHGAFAESSSWNPVIALLIPKGYKVIAVANPLREVKGDAAYVAGIIDTVQGPIILVGHFYGRSVITEAATGHSNVKALI